VIYTPPMLTLRWKGKIGIFGCRISLVLLCSYYAQLLCSCLYSPLFSSSASRHYTLEVHRAPAVDQLKMFPLLYKQEVLVTCDLFDEVLVTVCKVISPEPEVRD